MANDRYHRPQERRRGSSTTTGGSSHGQSHGSKHSRKHRIPQPPVPHAQASLLQAPPPPPTQHAAQRATASYPHAAATAAAEPAAPTVDPEDLPAKQGLNEWGAFTRGNPGSGGNGTFGFGPLLFHKNNGNGSQRSRPGPDQAAGAGGSGSRTPAQQEASSTRRDLDALEMDRLVLNDPLSFNPLAAISWAKLDDEDLDDDAFRPRAAASSSSAQGEDPASGAAEDQRQTAPEAAQGESLQSSRDNYVPGAIDTQMRPSPGPARSVMRNAYGSIARADHLEHTPSPVGNMSQTLPDATLQTQENCITYVPPPMPSHVSGSTTPSHAGSGAQSSQSRQQRKQRHRQDRGSAKASHAAPEVYQAAACPPPLPPLPVYPHPLPAQPPFPGTAQQMQPFPTYQAPTPQMLHPAAPYGAPAPGPQQQQQQHDLFLCLGPYCAARFPTEAQLNAHYRAEHSLSCNWTSCGATGFTSNNALVWHIKAEHLLLCPVPGCCDRVFANRKQLEGHVRVS